jgi:hypothetical protein
MSCRSSLSFLSSVLHMTLVTHPIFLPVINMGFFIRPPTTSATGWSASLNLRHSSNNGLSFKLWGLYITLPKPPDLNVSYCNFSRPTHTRSMNSLYSLPEATPFPVPPLHRFLKQIWVNVVVTAVDPSSMFSVIWHLCFPYGRFVWIFRGHFSTSLLLPVWKVLSTAPKCWSSHATASFSEWNHIPFLLVSSVPFKMLRHLLFGCRYYACCYGVHAQ